MGKTESVQSAGISSEAVEAKTGKGWNEWFRVLDKAGARKLPHKEIAAILRDKHGVQPWWTQMVAVGYEQARGLRALHQKADGFEASSSKTFPVPVSDLFRRFSDASLRAKWLGKERLTVRTSTEPKSMRITWGDGTNLEINFWAKGEAKSAVQLQHNKLAGEADVQARKAFWKAALGRLAEQVGK
jgi:hypothetical protein